jgi:hypothetical protein
MNRPMQKRIASFAIIFTLFCGTALPILADTGTGATTPAPAPAPKPKEVIAGTTPVGSVAINNKSSFELKQVSILAGDEDKTVTFTVTVKNGEDKELQFIDYWIRLTNAIGAKYTINLFPEDKDKNRIAPRSSLDFHFYAKVNSATELKDLKFNFIQWDFSASNYERMLGEISVPATYSDLTPIEVKRLVPVLGTSLKTAVTRVAVKKNDENYLVTVYYSMENVGLKSVKLPVFAFDIHTSEGYIYPLDVAPLKDLTIAPKVKKEVQLNATIPISVLPKNWTLLVTKEDATVKTLPVANYALPQATDDSAGGSVEDSVRPIDISGTSVATSISRASVSKTETNYLTNIFFTFANNGAKAVTLPNYLFNVKTKEGLIYPLVAAGLKDISLNPKESKEFQLSVSIPISVDVGELELQLIQPTAAGVDSSFNYPIASYIVPPATSQEVSIGAEYPYTNKNGSYSAKLTSIQRLPWEDQDIISAEITINNKGAASAPPIKLQGYYMLDGNIKIDANLLQLDSIVSLPTKSSSNYVLMSKIPYTSQFSTLKLVLQEKTSDTVSETIAEFNGNADLMALPTIAKGESYQLQNVGKSSELKITNLYTYKGTTNDLYYLELDMKSLEKRFTAASKLATYLKTKDDLYFPAAISDVTQKISPGGKAVMAIWSELPQGFKAGDLELMIGLADSRTTGSGETTTTSVDGYYRVAKMVLPDENTTVKSSPDGLAIQPYTIGLSNFKSFPSSSPFNVTFDANLLKNSNSSPELGANTHKLVVEITDSLSNKYEKSFDLDKDLKLGKNSMTIPITFNDDLNKGIEFMNSINRNKSYTIQVYDEIKGYRKLLSTSSASWFPTH